MTGQVKHIDLSGSRKENSAVIQACPEAFAAYHSHADHAGVGSGPGGAISSGTFHALDILN